MKQRVALVSLTVVGAAVVYVAVSILAALIGWAVAHADTGAPAIGDATAAIQKFGWWGGALVVYVGVRWFLKTNESTHWLAHGRTLSIATAVLSVLGAVVGWRFGMDPDVITFAAAGAIPLAIPSTVKPSPVTASGEIGETR